MRSRLVSIAALAVLGAAAGCVDTTRCHTAVDWKPCAGETAEPGASGTPPQIVELSLPTCASVDAPTVSGTLHVTDADGDAQVLKVALTSGGMRSDETELELDDAGRSGNDWSGSFSLMVTGSMGGMVMQGSDDVRVKVTDRAGGQSLPLCNTIAIVQ